MSVQTLPRWQRALLRWFLERKIRKGKRSLPCPQCQGHVPLPQRLNDALWDMLVTCPHCGHTTSLMEIAADRDKTPEDLLGEGRLQSVLPPSSRITVEVNGTTRTWTVPAKGGCSGILLFGIIWFLFSSFFVVSMLSANKPGGIELGAILIVGTFVLIGVGLIYAGLCQSHSFHILQVDAVELIHERRTLGRLKRRSLPRQDISSIELVVFYTENYKPVHGIEIKAGPRKIKFGSALTAEEKAWLCEELRQAVSLRHTAAPLSASAEAPLRDNTSILGSAPRSRIKVERRGHGSVVHISPGKIGKGILIMGTVFVAVATFMIVMGARMWINSSDGPPLFFRLLWNGFCLFWCGGVATFGVMGLGVMITGWRMNRTHHQITATPEALQVVETCGATQHETLVPAAEVQDIRTGIFQSIQSNSGNQQTTEVQHRGVIVLSDRVIGFGGGCNLQELTSAIAALNQALGRG